MLNNLIGFYDAAIELIEYKIRRTIIKNNLTCILNELSCMKFKDPSNQSKQNVRLELNDLNERMHNEFNELKNCTSQA